MKLEKRQRELLQATYIVSHSIVISVYFKIENRPLYILYDMSLNSQVSTLYVLVVTL